MLLFKNMSFEKKGGKMQEKTKNKLWKIPSMVTVFAVISLGSWYLIASKILAISQVELTEYITIQLPFAISRLWDIPAIFIWTFILVFLFTNEKIKNDKETLSSLMASLFVGFFLGLATGLMVGLFVGLGTALVTSLIVAPSFTGFNSRAGFLIGLGTSIGVGIGLGVVSSFGIGLCIGLILFAGFTLGFSLIFGLIAGIRFLFSEKSKN